MAAPECQCARVPTSTGKTDHCCFIRRSTNKVIPDLKVGLCSLIEGLNPTVAVMVTATSGTGRSSVQNKQRKNKDDRNDSPALCFVHMASLGGAVSCVDPFTCKKLVMVPRSTRRVSFRSILPEEKKNSGQLIYTMCQEM